MSSYLYEGFVYGIVGIVISYLLITYGIMLLFPKLHEYEKATSRMENTLNVNKMSAPLSIGVCNFDSSTIQLNTSNPRTAGFVHLPQSNNLKGGAQFSYSFWLDTKSYNMYDLSDRVIFMRGVHDKKYSEFSSSLPFVACPLVKFGPSIGQANTDKFGNRSPYLEVIFNTTKNPHSRIGLNQAVFDMTRSTNMNPRWFLITITLKDYVDFRNYEHGIQVQSFINDNLVYTDVIKNDSLKLNNSDFYITPNDASMQVKNINSMYADITYYNYALSINEIESIYNRGVTNENSVCSTAKANSMRAVSDDKYQRLDKNNFL